MPNELFETNALAIPIEPSVPGLVQSGKPLRIVTLVEDKAVFSKIPAHRIMGATCISLGADVDRARHLVSWQKPRARHYFFDLNHEPNESLRPSHRKADIPVVLVCYLHREPAILPAGIFTDQVNQFVADIFLSNSFVCAPPYSGGDNREVGDFRAADVPGDYKIWEVPNAAARVHITQHSIGPITRVNIPGLPASAPGRSLTSVTTSPPGCPGGKCSCLHATTFI